MGSISLSSQDGDSLVVILTASSEMQKVIGRVSPSVPDSLQEFRGIPYAKVPGRWRHSILNTRLPANEFLATKNGPQCPQPPEFANSDFYQSHLDWPTDVDESEFDCVNLFIIRPSPEALSRAGFDPSSTKLPVYVNIHGGGFGFGAGTDPMWDPSRLISRSLVVGEPLIGVNINYRLGIFGFGMSSDILAMQTGQNELRGGNFGLGDQRNALRWVSRNIADFGGDPSKITIAGQSAGGKSVHTHLLEAKFGTQPPLFRRAIQQSGAYGTLGPVTLAEQDKKWQTLYERLGVAERSAEEKTRILLDLPAPILMKEAQRLGWIVFPPIKDDITICDRPNARWSVHLGQLEDLASAPTPTLQEPICVYIGDCEDENLLFRQISQIESFDQMERLFRSISPSTLKELYTTYDLTPETPIAALHARLGKIFTDFQFGYPVQDADDELSSTATDQMRPNDGTPAHPTTTRRFRIRFGNPFPGPNHHITHHCVDLIYIYDAFHADLTKIDQEALANPRPNLWASNDSLVASVQARWIHFVTDNHPDPFPVISDADAEARVTVYERDRCVESIDKATDPRWRLLMQRFAVVKKHAVEVGRMVGVVGALVPGKGAAE